MSFISWCKNTFSLSPKVSNTVQPQSRPGYWPNSIVKNHLERVQEVLEKQTGLSFVIGERTPADIDALPDGKRPIHDPSQTGYLLYYLARVEADHVHGPILGEENKMWSTWVLCAAPDGLRLLFEVFDMDLCGQVLSALNELSHGAGFVQVVTEHRVGSSIPFFRGSVEWMKYTILPKSEISPYRGKTTE